MNNTELHLLRQTFHSYVDVAPVEKLMELVRYLAGAHPRYRNQFEWLHVVCQAEGDAAPIPAPLVLCEEIYDELEALDHILRWVLTQTDNRAYRADIRKHRRVLERLHKQLGLRHVAPRPVPESEKIK